MDETWSRGVCPETNSKRDLRSVPDRESAREVQLFLLRVQWMAWVERRGDVRRGRQSRDPDAPALEEPHFRSPNIESNMFRVPPDVGRGRQRLFEDINIFCRPE
jgi:hypothetical protein